MTEDHKSKCTKGAVVIPDSTVPGEEEEVEDLPKTIQGRDMKEVVVGVGVTMMTRMTTCKSLGVEVNLEVEVTSKAGNQREVVEGMEWKNRLAVKKKKKKKL